MAAPVPVRRSWSRIGISCSHAVATEAVEIFRVRDCAPGPEVQHASRRLHAVASPLRQHGGVLADCSTSSGASPLRFRHLPQGLQVRTRRRWVKNGRVRTSVA